jgi:hypothetical protein
LLRAKTKAGLLRTNGTIDVERRLGEREALAAALLATYLLLREQESGAAAASAATTAAT